MKALTILFTVLPLLSMCIFDRRENDDEMYFMYIHNQTNENYIVSGWPMLDTRELDSEATIQISSLGFSSNTLSNIDDFFPYEDLMRLNKKDNRTLKLLDSDGNTILEWKSENREEEPFNIFNESASELEYFERPNLPRLQGMPNWDGNYVERVWVYTYTLTQEVIDAYSSTEDTQE